jgi:hypothetical protein
MLIPSRVPMTRQGRPPPGLAALAAQPPTAGHAKHAVQAPTNPKPPRSDKSDEQPLAHNSVCPSVPDSASGQAISYRALREAATAATMLLAGGCAPPGGSAARAAAAATASSSRHPRSSARSAPAAPKRTPSCGAASSGTSASTARGNRGAAAAASSSCRRTKPLSSSRTCKVSRPSFEGASDELQSLAHQNRQTHHQRRHKLPPPRSLDASRCAPRSSSRYRRGQPSMCINRWSPRGWDRRAHDGQQRIGVLAFPDRLCGQHSFQHAGERGRRDVRPRRRCQRRQRRRRVPRQQRLAQRVQLHQQLADTRDSRACGVGGGAG